MVAEGAVEVAAQLALWASTRSCFMLEDQLLARGQSLAVIVVAILSCVACRQNLLAYRQDREEQRSNNEYFSGISLDERVFRGLLMQLKQHLHRWKVW